MILQGILGLTGFIYILIYRQLGLTDASCLGNKTSAKQTFMTESLEILNNYNGKFGNSNRLSLARTLKTVPEMRAYFIMNNYFIIRYYTYQ